MSDDDLTILQRAVLCYRRQSRNHKSKRAAYEKAGGKKAPPSNFNMLLHAAEEVAGADFGRKRSMLDQREAELEARLKRLKEQQRALTFQLSELRYQRKAIEALEAE